MRPICAAVLLLSLLALAPARSAWAVYPATLSDPVLEARYQGRFHELHCMQCENN